MQNILKFIIATCLFFILYVTYAWLARPWEHLKALNALDVNTLSKGQEELKKHKIVIVGIVRDSVLDVHSVSKYIEHTGGFVKDYRVIFENDSTDGTKWVLNRWAAANDKVKIISEDFGYKRRPSIQFMADIRNRYIDVLKSDPEYADFDMVMVVDMDMKNGWDIRGIFDSFSKINQWDAVCSNGIWYGERAYDMFAFRNGEFLYGSQDFWKKIQEGGWKFYPVGSSLVKVDSCFGGMAFYKRDAIKGCRYESVDEDCEHVAFNRCVVDQNFGKMFMNPSQMIRYFTLDWLF